MRRITTAAWMAMAFAGAIAFAGAALIVAVPPQKLGMALRATARWSFVWFCLATYGAPLAVLFGERFRGLARRSREFGLSFAAALVVHFVLAIRQIYVSPVPFPRLPLIVFSLGVASTLVLTTLTVMPTVSAHLGPNGSRRLRTIGVEYIAFAFAFEFGGRILSGNRANAIHYLPLFVLAVTGPILRVLARAKRRPRPQTAGVAHG